MIDTKVYREERPDQRGAKNPNRVRSLKDERLALAQVIVAKCGGCMDKASVTHSPSAYRLNDLEAATALGYDRRSSEQANHSCDASTMTWCLQVVTTRPNCATCPVHLHNPCCSTPPKASCFGESCFPAMQRGLIVAHGVLQAFFTSTCCRQKPSPTSSRPRTSIISTEPIGERK